MGIGGAGMSGIAQVFHTLGYDVSGSDLKRSRYTRMLEEAGVAVAIGHAAGNLDRPDAVVVSTAIPPHNPELVAAVQRGIPVFQRAQMLAELMSMKRGIAVAGTHGKTTTTSMIANTMELLDLKPSFVVGGELNDVGSNARAGEGDWLVAEADESDGSLLHLRPEIAVITNVELDHHSHYASIDEVIEVFRKFVSELPEDGALVIWDQPLLREIAKSTRARVVTYGTEESADYRATDLESNRAGTSFSLAWPGGGAASHSMAADDTAPGSSAADAEPCRVSLMVRGVHNVMNSLAAIAVLDLIGTSPRDAGAALASFSGAARRFQIKGEAAGVTIVDDYAHHPTEIAATLEAARSGGWTRVIGAFQPHLYSRTRYLHDEFGKALNNCDLAIVTDIYGAREEPEPGISGKLVIDSALKWSPNANVAYIPKTRDIVPLLLRELRPGDLLLTIGAGDIFKVGEDLLAALQRQESLV
ncbi:MAG: UDP-N-acetylmuramate--L-alanine ligase [Thermoleophilia bacterium]|nr:UDP-N-acetylmuramate--L-alanine ligase [Thermoleophilia bacterium]